MPITWKSFTVNNVGDPKPWSGTEVQLHKDLIDTIVMDDYAQAKDATNGHRHYRLYSTSNAVIARGVSQGVMRQEFNASVYSQFTTSSSGGLTIAPTGNTTAITGSLRITKTTEQFALNYDVSNSAAFTVSSGGVLTIDPSGDTITVAGTVLGFSSNAVVNRGTTDGSDNGFVGMCGGGGSATTRGALALLYGNEHSTLPGRMVLAAGSGGQIVLSDIPTSDPTVAGAVFRDGTSLKISTG